MIAFEVYKGEEQLEDLMRLISKDLSEPYSIYTFRYFIHSWPQLCHIVPCLCYEYTGLMILTVGRGSRKWQDCGGHCGEARVKQVPDATGLFGDARCRLQLPRSRDRYGDRAFLHRHVNELLGSALSNKLLNCMIAEGVVEVKRRLRQAQNF